MNHHTAEYADRRRSLAGHGLGGLVTDYCEEVATRWGVKRSYETSKDNAR